MSAISVGINNPGSSGGITRYSLSPAPDGITTVFTAPVTITANAVIVSDDLVLISATDYTVAGTQITFSIPPKTTVAVFQ